jgi:hypothetical protein
MGNSVDKLLVIVLSLVKVAVAVILIVYDPASVEVELTAVKFN